MSRSPRHTPHRSSILAALAIALAVAGFLALVLKLHWLLSSAVGVNIATLALYGFDKRHARLGRGRVPEAVLHLFAALGGSPGALMGQQLFRHKTRKVSFQVIFWLIVAAQLTAVVYYLSS